MARVSKSELRIARLYRERCSNIQINIMDISKIYDDAREGIAAGLDDAALGDRIAAFVETIRPK